MNVLIFAAHPDDEILGAGGAIAKHIQNGDNVKIVILGTGITSRNSSEQEKELTELEQDAKNASNVLGVSDLELLDLPDNKFDSVSLLEVIKKIEPIIEKFNPEVVYTHHYGDLNVDHRITFKAVLTACRPISGVKKILCFEILSSTEWQVQSSEKTFKPNYFVDISSTLEKKLNAMGKYKNELRDYPHSRSLEGIKALAMFRGVQSFKKYSEAFELIREVC